MPSQPVIAALIVAAGEGARAGGGVPKQYRRMGGQSLLAAAVDSLARHPAVARVQVVIGVGQETLYAEAVRDRPLPPPVLGGATRRASVANGLAALGPEVTHVLVHDAARSAVPAEVTNRLVAALAAHDAAVPVLPVTDTLAGAGVLLGPAVDRAGVVRVQTPQAFRLAALSAAHDGWTGAEPTDDAGMVRAIGTSVAAVEGDRRLEKITHPEDLTVNMVTRVGTGFDVHAFAPGDAVMLCGVAVPHARGLAGHSDADVGLHTLVDALLGTLADGDIGQHFPPTDERWRGAASSRFVEFARERVAAAGGVIDHVDLTLICERPKVGPHREVMRARVAELLGLPVRRVSVKATTTERLGFTGREEGIAAQAAVSVRYPEE